MPATLLNEYGMVWYVIVIEFMKLIAAPGEWSEKPQSSNGAGSPALRCKTDENHNALVDSTNDLELLELRIAVDDADDGDGSTSSGLGVCVKGMSAGQNDLGLFIKRIIDGRAAAKVGARTRVDLIK